MIVPVKVRGSRTTGVSGLLNASREIKKVNKNNYKEVPKVKAKPG